MNKGVNPGKVIAELTYQYLQWVTELVAKYPKSHKFQLGDRIQNLSIDILMLIVEATYTRDRAPLLRRAQIFLEQLRFLFRLSFDAKLISEGGYAHAARRIDELGRSIGGWQKAHNAQATRSPVREVRDISGAAPRGETGDQV